MTNQSNSSFSRDMFKMGDNKEEAFFDLFFPNVLKIVDRDRFMPKGDANWENGMEPRPVREAKERLRREFLDASLVEA